MKLKTDMKLIRQELTTHCVAASFAMVMDCTIDEIVAFIGHDGCKQIGSDSNSLAGYHIQELIDFALARGYAVTEIEYAPAYLSDDGQTVMQVDFKTSLQTRFENRLSATYRGVLLVVTPRGGHHALAFENSSGSIMLYDPRTGKIATLDEFLAADQIAAIIGFLRFDKLSNLIYPEST